MNRKEVTREENIFETLMCGYDDSCEIVVYFHVDIAENKHLDWKEGDQYMVLQHSNLEGGSLGSYVAIRNHVVNHRDLSLKCHILTLLMSPNSHFLRVF